MRFVYSFISFHCTLLLSSQIPIDSTPSDSHAIADELQDNVVSDEGNADWQGKQVDLLRNQIGDSLSIDYNVSLDEIVQQIANGVTQEREDFNKYYKELEKANADLRSGNAQ